VTRKLSVSLCVFVRRFTAAAIRILLQSDGDKERKSKKLQKILILLLLHRAVTELQHRDVQSTILAPPLFLQASALSQPEDLNSRSRVVGYRQRDSGLPIMRRSVSIGRLWSGSGSSCHLRKECLRAGRSLVLFYPGQTLLLAPSGANWPAGTQVFGLSRWTSERKPLLPVQWTPH
jgi:hypothetical protein